MVEVWCKKTKPSPTNAPDMYEPADLAIEVYGND